MFDAGCNIAYAVHMHNAINDDQLLWRAKKDVCKKKNMSFQQSNLKWPRLQSCKEIRPDQEKQKTKLRLDFSLSRQKWSITLIVRQG